MIESTITTIAILNITKEKTKMKLSKLLVVTVIAAGLGTTSTALIAAPTAEAKASVMRRTFPKNFRHNWYMSAGKHGNAMKFTAKTVAMRYDTNTGFTHFKLVTHKPARPEAKSKKYHYISWLYAKQQRRSVHIDIWDNATLPLAGNYRVKTKTYRGHKIKMLQEVSGGHVNATYYTTKKLAAHFNK